MSYLKLLYVGNQGQHLPLSWTMVEFGFRINEHLGEARFKILGRHLFQDYDWELHKMFQIIEAAKTSCEKLIKDP